MGLTTGSMGATCETDRQGIQLGCLCMHTFNLLGTFEREWRREKVEMGSEAIDGRL